MPIQNSVYLLDDNQDTLESLALLLQLEGFKTVCGKRAANAMSDLRASGCRTAIIDLSMPDKDGFSVGREIRAEPSLSGTFLIAYSASVDDETIERCRNCGFDYFLMKPSDPETMLACIRRQPPQQGHAAECVRCLSARTRPRTSNNLPQRQAPPQTVLASRAGRF
jgi:DNA-binding response OmpR family regulator